MRHACAKCGCTTLTPGRCTTCARPSNQQKNKRATARVYQSTQWRTLRDRVLHRDNHTCQRCGAHATHVAHVIPFTDAHDPRAWDTTNLQAECPRCNGREAGIRRHQATA